MPLKCWKIHLFDKAVCKYPKKSYEQLTEVFTHIWCKEFEIIWTPFKGRTIQGKKVLPEKVGMAVLVTQKRLIRQIFNFFCILLIFLHKLDISTTRHEKSFLHLELSVMTRVPLLSCASLHCGHASKLCRPRN